MGGGASAERRTRLHHADRTELFNILQEISRNTQEEDLAEEHKELLLKALEVEDAKKSKEIQKRDEEDLEEKDEEEVQHHNKAVQHCTEATRCSVESTLKTLLMDHEGILPRECWIEFLQLIGGTEQDTHALLKDQHLRLSAEEFLDVVFGPQVRSKEDGEVGRTANLRDFFQKHYREGGDFCHRDYEEGFDFVSHSWIHRPTGIQVWRDAIDLTSGCGGEVYFHYTSELAFRNITSPDKKAAEVWASLNTDPGPKQNAWWGKGVYAVPKPPDQWQDTRQLLDNNFRNMMARDRADPEKGPTYVDEEYPKRVAFCIPIIIDAASAFDVSVRATPEMEAAGKAPGRNLGDKLLNEPGMPDRCCIVLRVSGEGGVQHAQGQLLDALERRARLSASYGSHDDKRRLGFVLSRRGLYDEALPVVRELLVTAQLQHGPRSGKALDAMTDLGILLRRMGKLSESLKLNRRELEATEAIFGPESLATMTCRNNLAIVLDEMGNHAEAADLHRKILEFRHRTFGPEGPRTLESMHNLAISLWAMGSDSESLELQRKTLELRERLLGPEHPDTLASLGNLAIALEHMGELSEAEKLFRKGLELEKRTLGASHPFTVDSLEKLARLLDKMGNHSEAVELRSQA